MGRRERRALSLSSGAALLCLLLGLTPVGTDLRSGARGLLSPIAAPLVEAGGATNDLVGSLGELTHVWSENQDLKSKLASQTSEIARLRDVESENQDLKSELGLPLYTNNLLSAAEVIGQSRTGTAVIINRGSSDGLRAGMPVVKTGNLVGQVAKTSRSSATVRLLTDPRLEIPVSITEDHLQALLVSDGGTLKLSLVPKGQTVRVGSHVVSSGIGETFPAGILVGTVEAVQTGAPGLFQNIILSPSIQPIGLRRVFILTGHR